MPNTPWSPRRCASWIDEDKFPLSPRLQAMTYREARVLCQRVGLRLSYHVDRGECRLAVTGGTAAEREAGAIYHADLDIIVSAARQAARMKARREARDRARA